MPIVIPFDSNVYSRGKNRRQVQLAAGLTAALGLVGSCEVVYAQAVNLIQVDIKTVAQGYQGSKLVGRPVYNDKGEKIGTLDDLIVTGDKNLYAVLQVGGFLGLGGHLIALPYDSLKIDDDGRKLTLAGASKDALGKLPEFQYKK